MLNLIISLRYNADVDELNQWSQTFQKASELMFAATDGQQQLGKIYVCNNSTGGKNADAWLDEDPGISSSNARIWEEFAHVDWKNDEKYKPFIIVHELGHYLYALGDEYTGPFGPANCIGDPAETPNACIMERSWSEGDRFGENAEGGDFVEGETTDYCVASNHDLGEGADDVANDTRQSSRHGEACWQTIVDTYPDLALPGDLPDEDRPDGFDNIEWLELTEDLRFVLVIDRSGSMGANGARPMEEAIYGSSFWADNALNGDFLGVVSFDNIINTHALTEIDEDADRNAIVDFIDDLTPRNSTAIGDALREGLNMITDAGDQSCTQVIVLFSDGKHNTGEDPDSELEEDADNESGESFMALADHKMSRNGEHTAYIERGCSVATFAVSWQGGTILDLALRSPSGQVITQTLVEDDIRHAYRGMPFRLIQLRRPESGLWRYKISKSKTSTRYSDNLVSYRHYVFAETKGIQFVVTSPRRRYEIDEPIHLLGQITAQQIVTGVPVYGYVIGPDGKSSELIMVDNGNIKQGSEIAGSGRFSAIYHPGMQGQYTFTFVADNRKRKACVALNGDVERSKQRGSKNQHES